MPVRQLSPRLLLGLFLLIPWVSTGMNYLFTTGFFEPLHKATGGLLHITWQANLVGLALFGFILFRLGGLRPADILLTRYNLISGLKWGFFLWLSAQLINLAWVASRQQPPALHEFTLQDTGYLLGQMLGNALLEELLYRGVFLIQLYLLLRTRTQHTTALILALLLSQALFSLIHIPNRLLVKNIDNLPANLLRLWVAGLLLGLIYLRTGNFAFVVMVHAFYNTPFTLLSTTLNMKLLIVLLSVITAAVWPRLTSRNKYHNLLRSGFRPV